MIASRPRAPQPAIDWLFPTLPGYRALGASCRQSISKLTSAARSMKSRTNNDPGLLVNTWKALAAEELAKAAKL